LLNRRTHRRGQLARNFSRLQSVVTFPDLNCARELKLTPPEKSVLMQLANITNRAHQARVSISTLVEWTSFSHTTVLRALDRLEARRLIVRNRSPRRRATTYELCLPEYEGARRARLKRQRGFDFEDERDRGRVGSQRTNSGNGANQAQSHAGNGVGSGRTTFRKSPVYITGASPTPTQDDKAQQNHRGYVPTSDRLGELLADLEPEPSDED
jgi:DNA-binding MarR family transcriptional regulator